MGFFSIIFLWQTPDTKFIPHTFKKWYIWPQEHVNVLDDKKILVKIKVPAWERYLQPLMQSPGFLLRAVFIVFTSCFSISGMRMSGSFLVSSVETDVCGRRGKVGILDSFSNIPAAGWGQEQARMSTTLNVSLRAQPCRLLVLWVTD